jgi:glycosyltransferase involved in cell wall biosynthesis
MRVCVISPFSIVDKNNWGGITTHTEMLCRLLVKMGHSVTLITSGEESKLTEESAQAVRVIHLPQQWRNVPAKEWLSSAARVFFEKQRAEPFDCLFSEGNSACELIRRYGDPGLPLFCFIHVPSFMHFYNNWQEVDGPKAFLSYILKTVPVIIHRIFFWERPLARAADKVISVSQLKAGQIRGLYGLKGDNVLAVNNWVDTRLFFPEASLRTAGRRQYGISDDAVVFLAISGILWRPKGFHLAVEGLSRISARVKNSILLLSGEDGPEKNNLMRLINRKGLAEKVRFTGAIEHSKLPMLYNAADIFLIPSLMSEGQAYTLLEAMSCGLAPIASRLGGNIESVGDCGLFFPHGNYRKLAKAMLELAVNIPKRREFSLKSRERCLQLFSEEIAREKISVLLGGLGKWA